MKLGHIITLQYPALPQKSLGISGVVQAFLENEKDILNTVGLDNKFLGAIWEFQKNVGFNMTNI